MFERFRLGALIQQDGELSIRQISVVDGGLETIKEEWGNQRSRFVDDAEVKPYDPGYNPEPGELSLISDYELPECFNEVTTLTISNRDPLKTDASFEGVTAIIGFAKLKGQDSEILLFQNFNKSHVLARHRIMFLNKSDQFEMPKNPGIYLAERLTAIYDPSAKHLFFQSFHHANTILPLTQYFTEAAKKDIHEVLSHKALEVAAAAGMASVFSRTQLYRKQFAMLQRSRVLDDYTPAQLKTKGKGFIDIEVKNNKIVVPQEKMAVRHLLKFLNEQIYKGPITDTIYETNSKREVES